MDSVEGSGELAQVAEVAETVEWGLEVVTRGIQFDLWSKEYTKGLYLTRFLYLLRLAYFLRSWKEISRTSTAEGCVCVLSILKYLLISI